MGDSRKVRDTQEERKLRDNIMTETKKLQEAIKQRENDEDSGDDIEILEASSHKTTTTVPIVVPVLKTTKSSGEPKVSSSNATRKKTVTIMKDLPVLEDTKHTRSILREDYNRELDKKRREHEE